jgi:hypothetical protein
MRDSERYGGGRDGDGRDGDERYGVDMTVGVPQRLTEALDVDPGSPEARAVELLSAAAPYQEAVGRKQRVWSAIEHPPARRPAWLLRPAVIAAVLIGGGAIGRAAVGHWPEWVIRAYQGLVVRPPPATTLALAESQRRPTGRRAGDKPSAPLAPSAPPVLVPAPAAAGETEPARRPVEMASPRARRAAPTGEETAPVLAAMRALRRDHDPARARGLLAGYLARYPSGALAEEALAMSIEAAVAHHDGDAGLLARRYLRLYPAGPFTQLARSAQATPTSPAP